ncbi:NAD(P)H-dependent oxidoreductase [Halolamina litorea]|jgi:NAD(P)H-dependent FMN reductase|uniref:NADPH-dependent FMN reductase n=1 Tax=Halolamina litorea TaxID=1515593 RepID=A0ABD6BUR3_9EURY|nr:NAD(P)H-dependent oxidoreductase [Halolamina litorea]
MTRVVAVSGSLRDGSYTKAALRYALDAAETAGVETELLDLAAADLPLYNPDRATEDAGDAEELLETVREADGVLLGSPVYHSSYSAGLRNFHDYCGFDEYEETVVGLLVSAGGGTIAGTLDDMRRTVRGVHGWVLPTQVGMRDARDRFADRDREPDPDEIGSDSQYAFVDEDLRARTCKLGYRLGTYAQRAPEFIRIDDEPDW